MGSRNTTVKQRQGIGQSTFAIRWAGTILFPVGPARHRRATGRYCAWRTQLFPIANGVEILFCGAMRYGWRRLGSTCPGAAAPAVGPGPAWRKARGPGPARRVFRPELPVRQQAARWARPALRARRPTDGLSPVRNALGRDGCHNPGMPILEMSGTALIAPFLEDRRTMSHFDQGTRVDVPRLRNRRKMA